MKGGVWQAAHCCKLLSVNSVGISRKLKSTCQDQNNVSTSFLSIIYDNLYQYQPMASLVAVDIDKSDFFLPLVKGATRFIAVIQLLKMKCPKLQKKKHRWTHISIE